MPELMNPLSSCEGYTYYISLQQQQQKKKEEHIARPLPFFSSLSFLVATSIQRNPLTCLLIMACFFKIHVCTACLTIV